MGWGRAEKRQRVGYSDTFQKKRPPGLVKIGGQTPTPKKRMGWEKAKGKIKT